MSAVLVLLLAGTFVPRPLFTSTQSAGETPHRILVLTNPIHTDIALPLNDAVRRQFGFIRDGGVPIDAPGARYLLLGWGGRDFYLQTPTWSELKLVPLLKGITRDRSVMHVEVTGDIDQTLDHVSVFDLTDTDLDALSDFMLRSFTTSTTGPIVIRGAGYRDYDAFYEAEGTFTALAGCNTWTAAALRAGGLRTGWWNPLPILLLFSMRLYN